METFHIMLDNIRYLVTINQCGTYSILVKDEEVLTLQAKLDKAFNFVWKTTDGNSSHFIEKIGIVIETRDLKF